MKRLSESRVVSRLRARVEAGERGYVAVTVGIMLMLLLSFCAFAVDVGNWYFTAQRVQRAADAGALAGVTYLPGNQTTAFSKARDYATKNEFTTDATTTVTPAIDGRPTRLRVTVTKTVNNQFGWLMGRNTTTVSRTAVADYAGPVAMGSPCNEFGDDPDPGINRGTTCSGVNGKLWASISSRGAQKQNGDAYQASGCTTTPVDLCTGTSNNSEYDLDGYFVTVSVKAPMPRLVIEAFDPMWVNVGPDCDDTSFGTSTTEARDAVNDQVTNPSTRYVTGDGPWCTGDRRYSGTVNMKTSFTVRAPSANAWNALSFQPVAGCSTVYDGFSSTSSSGLFNALDQYTSGTTPRSTYNPELAKSFRRWTPLCTIDNPEVGDYLVQIKTNGVTETADAANRYSIRAYSPSDSTAKNSISVAGREKMAIYANAGGATTEFYLARVPTGAAGMTLNVRLFDVGDSTDPGSITISKPPDAFGDAFTDCVGTGPRSGTFSTCSFGVTTSSHQGKWQTVSVPIPPNYKCTDADPTKCWVRLTYPYGPTSNPHDQTTWTANIEGDPVRLVE